jgi:murein DD-endopeptidase MepM/ murein hydrolase activator NlpD
LDKPAGLIIEYLHIGSNVPVDVGERVSEGQVIAFSSDNGFAPEPHLHIEAHMENDDASLLIAFKGENRPFVPTAGVLYNENGMCEKSSDAPRKEQNGEKRDA